MREDLGPLRGRVAWLRRLVIALVALFAVVLAHMQLVEFRSWRELAENNHLKEFDVPAERGLVRDAAGRVMVSNRAAHRVVLFPDRGTSRKDALMAAARVVGIERDTLAELRTKLKDPFTSKLVLAHDAPLQLVSRVEARRLELPELEVRDTLVRYYHAGPSAAHVLGHVGEIREDQLVSGRFEGYRQGDVIGQSGLESRYESWLRGHKGKRLVAVDSRGREVRQVGIRSPARRGNDLTLTIDLEVQRAGEQAFGDYSGAAVLLDIDTGAVVAMISLPSYDPNSFASGVSAQLWSELTEDPTHPLFDRPLKGRTSPGSVFKVVASLAGLEERVLDPDRTVNCNGWTVLHGEVFRCWRAGGHGPVNLERAIEKSCNVYFYRLGDTLGIERLARYSRMLGLGQGTGIDLDGEGRGLVPDPDWKRKTFNQPWWPGETVSVAIGQGALGVTVLETAMMMATVARDGVAMRPHLVASIHSGDEVVWRQQPERVRSLELRGSSVHRVKQALCAVVNREGTARRARIDGYEVCGKTGTAQVKGRRSEGPAPKEHAWFAGYAPGWDPRFAVAVLVEHGGHGGETAAPVARELFARALEMAGVAPRLPQGEDELLASTRVAP